MSFKKYAEYKESGIEWLGEVPKHWEIKRLKHSIRSCKNGIWGGETQGDANDIPCVRVADFDRQKLRVILNEPTIRNVKESERIGRVLSKGNLLLEKSGGGENQPVGCVVLYSDDQDAVCSNFVARVELAKGMDSSYLRYVHAAAYAVRLTTRSINQTSGIQNLDQDRYFNEYSVFPLAHEQSAIAVFLDRETEKIDVLITEQEQLIALLKEKRQAVISHVVTKGLDLNVPMKETSIDWFVSIPEHWNVTKMKDVTSKIGSGKTPKGGAEVYTETGVTFIRSQNVHFKGLHLDDVVYIDEATNREMSGTRLKPDDVLLNITGASIGRCCLVPKDLPSANVNQHVCILRPVTSRIVPKLLNYIVSSNIVQSQISIVNQGTSREGLNFQQASNIVFACPKDLEEQFAIVEFLERKIIKIENLLEKAIRAIDLLKERRTALITAAVTGKIDVRGLVEEVIV